MSPCLWAGTATILNSKRRKPRPQGLPLGSWGASHPTAVWNPTLYCASGPLRDGYMEGARGRALSTIGDKDETTTMVLVCLNPHPSLHLRKAPRKIHDKINPQKQKAWNLRLLQSMWQGVNLPTSPAR